MLLACHVCATSPERRGVGVQYIKCRKMIDISQRVPNLCIDKKKKNCKERSLISNLQDNLHVQLPFIGIKDSMGRNYKFIKQIHTGN